MILIRLNTNQFVRKAFEASNRLRLPGPSVLPVAGAVVGVYAGLAAGIFANLIGLVSGVAFGFARVLSAFNPRSDTFAQVQAAFRGANWHFEYAIVALPLALTALVASR